MTTLHFPS
jgi:hypothetical protein